MKETKLKEEESSEPQYTALGFFTTEPQFRRDEHKRNELRKLLMNETMREALGVIMAGLNLQNVLTTDSAILIASHNAGAMDVITSLERLTTPYREVRKVRTLEESIKGEEDPNNPVNILKRAITTPNSAIFSEVNNLY